MNPPSNAYASPSMKRSFALWIGSLGGAVMWSLHLVGVYLVSEFGCTSGWGDQTWLGISQMVWLGIALSLAMLCGALLACHVADRQRRQHPGATDSQPNDAAGGEAFLVAAGLLSNQIFSLIIAVQTVPFLFYLRGC